MDPIQLLLQQAANATSAFLETSRYRYTPILIGHLPDGRPVTYVGRRFLPPPDAMATAAEHVVAPGDRLDNLAQKYVGDPEQFWRICDANRALRPADLIDDPPATGTPRVIRIGLPAGIPAPAQF